jgi:CHAT domain-containing protein
MRWFLLFMLVWLGPPVRAQDLPPDRAAFEVLAGNLWYALTIEGRVDEVEAYARGLYVPVSRAAQFGPAEEVELQLVIGRATLMRARFAEALELGQQTVAHARQNMSPDDPLVWRAVLLEMEALVGTGAFGEAVGRIARVVLEAEAVLAPDHPATLILRGLLARAASLDGRPALAMANIDLVIAALRPRTAEADRTNLAMMMMERGMLLQRTGQIREAVVQLQEALAVLDATGNATETSPDRLSLLSVLTEAMLVDGQGAAILDVITPVMARIAGKPEYALPWSRMAFLQAVHMIGDGTDPALLAEGTKLLEQAVAVRTPLVEPRNDVLLQAEQNLAMAYAAQHRSVEAVGLMRSMQARGWAPRRDFLVMVLGRASETGAMPEAEVTDDLFRMLQREAEGGAGQAQNLQNMARLAGPHGPLLTELALARGDVSDLRAALAAAASGAARDPATVANIGEQLAEAEKRTAILAADLQRKVPEIYSAPRDTPMSMAEVQAGLAPDAALVVLDVVPEASGQSLSIVITRDSATWDVIDVPHDSIAADVRAVRDSIDLRLGVRSAVSLTEPAAGPDIARDFDHAAARRLYDALIGPLEQRIGGKAHLLMDLRGPVAALPPHLLLRDSPAGSAPHWLVRDHAITILPSVVALRGHSLPAATAPLPMLAFADPDFVRDDDRSAGEVLQIATLRSGLAPLPETAQEVRAVAQSLGAGDQALHLGAAASEAALKATDLSRYDVIYFATHGLLGTESVGTEGQPLQEPALALTAGQGHDGFLTASEIAGLRLNAGLVVLSACNTGGGAVPGEAALSGLARAFLFAGARGLMVSHWPVESRSAVVLMTDLFAIRAVSPDIGLARAQQRAILSMIDKPADPRWSHPAYWAPFVLVGSPD